MFRPAEDLRELEGRGEYRNPTRDYWRHYRSTMVLPIRARRQEDADTRFVFAGFLCLDCKEPGGFGEPFARQPRHEDNPEDFNVAATIADALFWPLVWFSLRLHRPEMAPIPYLEEALRLEQIEHIEKEGGAK